VVCVCGVAFIFWSHSKDLPDIQGIEDYQPKQVTRVYAANGELIAEWTDADAIFRTVVPFDAISPVMRDAILAAEDSEFYSHPGLDFVGLVRATYTNVRRGRMSQGASTITQQVVKNIVLGPERSIRRKVQEAILAYRLEQALSKDEILTIYLNEVFFGVRYYGVEEASRYYFNTTAAELTLTQAALLAGLVQSPNRYNPYRHPERALERRAYVLRQMHQKGMIVESVYRDAMEAPLELAPRDVTDPYLGAFGYFTDAVRRELSEHFEMQTWVTGGFSVNTTLDTRTQIHAEEALVRGLQAFDARRGFHTPYATVAEGAAAERWRNEHARDVASVGLRAGEVYRGLILRSDDEETVLAIGPFEVALEREPLSRMRPDDRSWGELFPVGNVFSVMSPVDRSVAALQAESGDRVRVRLQPSAQGAVVVIDARTRHIRALVGGYDFSESPYNRAVQARRQVGSTFKSFIYAAALHFRVATPATIYVDQPVTFALDANRQWSPRNYDGEFLGPMSFRTALARSRNVIAVRVLDQLVRAQGGAMDFAPVIGFLRQAGVHAAMTENLTLALGSAEVSPLELTNAFATFADNGTYRAPIIVTSVHDRNGDLVWSPPDVEAEGMSTEVAWLSTSIMTTVIESGTGTRARRLGHPIAGKTGTTNDARDAWFVGYTPSVVASVWVGRDNNETLGRRENGSATALPIWIDLMDAILDGVEPESFPSAPDGVVAVEIDPTTGLRARPGRPGARTEYFLSGTEPQSFAPDPNERSVDRVLIDGHIIQGADNGLDSSTVMDEF